MEQEEVSNETYAGTSNVNIGKVVNMDAIGIGVEKRIWLEFHTVNKGLIGVGWACFQLRIWLLAVVR